MDNIQRLTDAAISRGAEVVEYNPVSGKFSLFVTDLEKILGVEYIAKAAHEVNRAYCRAIGDDSQPAWADAPAWQKDSAINGVKYRLEHPEATPEDMHISWMNQKIREGWCYGPTKDPVAKTHPCMVMYRQLPIEQRIKDYLFSAVVDSLK